MLSGVLTGAPVWVWPLLGVLLIIGLRAMRNRVSRVWPFTLMPLLAILAVNAVAGLRPSPELWALFAASYGAGAFIGWRFQPRWITGRDDSRVALKGEPLTLVMLLSIFLANFAAGAVTAMAPHLASSPGFQAGFTLIAGLASGLFLGRSLAILNATRSGLPKRQ
ncbi:hypothetical protein SAMN04515673_102161 [Poseidonocella sedimentorum]|uniref:DUF1453 domain-containing protein n=2 Tax=Poseidonocella sedimentorum TaxID=871652 RepID=A0A1I6D4T8_9RHOB|nr:hypothetical protein [Poseidonocella sedimentorum]SFR00455.1 hypothetical protein SAMN04515673_102161 [Poseidonocella sedimentorum]